MYYESEMHCRLRSCLQTILDLEEDLVLVPAGQGLLNEFPALKKVLAHLEDVEVSEADVLRIERATANFLSELAENIHLRPKRKLPGARLQ